MPLRPYQEIGAAWLNSRDRALLADDMGLGKSIQTLTAIPMNRPPVLIVCPAVVKGVWKSEAFKWRSDYLVSVYNGRGSFTRFPQPGEIVVVNYDVLPSLPSEKKNKSTVFDYVRGQRPAIAKPPRHWQGAPKGMIVIADEAQALIHWESKRSKAFNMLRNTALWNDGRVWLLSGTPLPSSPDNLWNVLSAANLEREAFGSEKRFQTLFGGYKENTRKRGGGFVEIQKWLDPALVAEYETERRQSLSRVMLRRLKSEVLTDLPPKQYSDVVLPLPEHVLRECDRFMAHLDVLRLSIEEFLALAAEGKIDISRYATLKTALASAKVEDAEQIVDGYEDASEPIVVFSGHLEIVNRLAKRTGWGTINGAVKGDKRHDYIEKFQRGELRGISATILAAGIGITLTRASNALFVDRDWTPANNRQAEDRIHRFGQTRGSLIIRLIGDHPMEARISAVLDKKQRMEESTL